MANNWNHSLFHMHQDPQSHHQQQCQEAQPAQCQQFQDAPFPPYPQLCGCACAVTKLLQSGCVQLSRCLCAVIMLCKRAGCSSVQPSPSCNRILRTPKGATLLGNLPDDTYKVTNHLHIVSVCPKWFRSPCEGLVCPLSDFRACQHHCTFFLLKHTK